MNRLGLLVLCVLSLPSLCIAQTGRYYVTPEAFVGYSRVVYVGKIVDLEPTDYKADKDAPLTRAQAIGDPYRLVFEVAETIRGDEVKRLELVLSLQSHHLLDYMRDLGTEVMLVAGPDRFSANPSAKVGIAEQEVRVDGDYYHFRLLDPLEVPDEKLDKKVASYARSINGKNDSCRMFDINLDVISGREEILSRARAFAKKYPKVLKVTTLEIPNEFGNLVGTPNAYCSVVLPVCEESKKTLEKVKATPGFFLRQVPPRIIYTDTEANRERLTEKAGQALKDFERAGK